MQRKTKKPLKESDIRPRPDVQRGIALEYPTHAAYQVAHRIERQYVAGEDKAAIPPGTSVPQDILFDQGHPPSFSDQTISGQRPDDASTDDGNTRVKILCQLRRFSDVLSSAGTVNRPTSGRPRAVPCRPFGPRMLAL